MKNYSYSTNHELYELADKFNIKLITICYKDQLNMFKPEQGAYIINLSNSTDGQGTHWVGLFLSNKKNDKKPACYYFDSLMLGVPQEVLDFCNRYSSIFYTNEDRIQNYYSGWCGIYVLVWLYHMTHANKNNSQNGGCKCRRNIMNNFIQYFDDYLNMSNCLSKIQ